MDSTTIIDTIKSIYNNLFVKMLKKKNVEIKDKDDFDGLALKIADEYEDIKQDIVNITHIIYRVDVNDLDEISMLLSTYLYLLEEYGD